MFVEYGGKSSSRGNGSNIQRSNNPTIVDSEASLNAAILQMQLLGGGKFSRKKKQVDV